MGTCSIQRRNKKSRLNPLQQRVVIRTANQVMEMLHLKVWTLTPNRRRTNQMSPQLCPNSEYLMQPWQN